MPERVSIGFGRNAFAILRSVRMSYGKTRARKQKGTGRTSLANFCKPVKFSDEIFAAEMFFVLQN